MRSAKWPSTSSADGPISVRLMRSWYGKWPRNSSSDWHTSAALRSS